MNSAFEKNLEDLMKCSEGRPDITIGLIDGSVDLTHPAFEGSIIRYLKDSQSEICKNNNNIPCIHGTFLAGILCANRKSCAPAICPGCTLLLNPVFVDRKQATYKDSFVTKKHQNNIILPTVTPENLSNAILRMVDSGAAIINLSLNLSDTSLIKYPTLDEAYEYARKRGVIIIAASGNQGNIGNVSLIDNDWVIPVASCNQQGTLDPISNISPRISRTGVMAPGINIISTLSGGGYVKLSGTSIAASFVTGVLAILWSIFPDLSAADLIYSTRLGSLPKNRHSSILPSLLNIESIFKLLQHFAKVNK